MLTLVICTGLCAAPAIAAPEQNTQTSIAIEAVIRATPPSGGSVATIVNATIRQQLPVAITDQFTGTWTLNQGPNSQNYGNQTITAIVPWSEATSATTATSLNQGVALPFQASSS
jgi:hypothetical protein